MFPVPGPLLVHGCGSRPSRSRTIRRYTRCPLHRFVQLRRGPMTYTTCLPTPVEDFGFDRLGEDAVAGATAFQHRYLVRVWKRAISRCDVSVPLLLNFCDARAYTCGGWGLPTLNDDLTNR